MTFINKREQKKHIYKLTNEIYFLLIRLIEGLKEDKILCRVRNESRQFSVII